MIPSNISKNHLKYWVKMRVHELGLTISSENIFLASSVDGQGFKKLESKNGKECRGFLKVESFRKCMNEEIYKF